jgi:hypothetical protein
VDDNLLFSRATPNDVVKI